MSHNTLEEKSFLEDIRSRFLTKEQVFIKIKDNKNLLLAKDDDGQTALHIAVSDPFVNTGLIQILLKAMKHIDIEDNNNETPHQIVLKRLDEHDLNYPSKKRLQNINIHFKESKEFKILEENFIQSINSEELSPYQIIDNKLTLFAKDSEDNGTLHAIASSSHDKASKVVEFLCEENIDIDAYNNNGQIPLHIAVSADPINIELIKALCVKVRNIDIENNDKKTPYQIADERGLEEVKSILDKTKQSFIASQIEFLNDVRSGRLIITQFINDTIKDPTLLHVKDSENGDGILHAVASSSSKSAPKMVEYLHSQGVDLSDCNNRKQTALHIAVSKDNVDQKLVEALCVKKKGHKVNGSDIKDDNEETPHEIASKKNLGRIAFLIDGFQIPESTGEEVHRKTILMRNVKYTARSNNLPTTPYVNRDIVRRVRGVKILPVTQEDFTQQESLEDVHLKRLEEEESTQKDFLKDIHSKEIGCEQIIDRIQKNPELLKAQDRYGNGIFHTLVLNLTDDSLKIIKFLCGETVNGEKLQESEFQSVNVNACNEEGQTALHIIASNDSSNDPDKKNSYFIDLLVKKGANADIEDNRKQKPLHVVIEGSFYSSKLVQHIYDITVDTESPNNLGETPLVIAVKRKVFEASKQFEILKIRKSNKSKNAITAATSYANYSNNNTPYSSTRDPATETQIRDVSQLEERTSCCLVS